MCMCMGTKTISIMDDAYNLLLNRKHKDESFSEVIRKLAGKKTDIMKFAGAWKHLNKEEIEERKRDVITLRRKSTKELLGRIRRLRDNDLH